MSSLWRRRKSSGGVALPPLPVSFSLHPLHVATTTLGELAETEVYKVNGIGDLGELPPDAHHIGRNGADPLLPQGNAVPNFDTMYRLGGAIGSGSVAVVRRATCIADDRQVAVKCIASDDEEVRQFALDEYALVRALRHPVIVSMEALFEGPSTIWICLELCFDGSVDSFVSQNGAFPERDVKLLAVQLLTGVNYLHQKRVVHRDLKPENLLLSNEARELKITDFNSATRIGRGVDIGGTAMLTDRGTRLFSAPELRFGRLWNERVDIWTCGLCLFFMLLARIPFDVQKPPVATALLAGKLPPIRWGSISDCFKNLVEQCLTVNVHDRPPAMELLLHRSIHQGSAQLATSSRPIGSQRSFSEEVDGLFLWLPTCGLLATCEVYRHGTRTIQTALRGSPGLAVTGWKERRDGSLQLGRLAASRFERTMACTKSPLSMEEPQPLYRRSFTRATGNRHGKQNRHGQV